ncbi:hypothetical protein LWI29_029101 [Acer saccharum]|uniref:Uncharacterized protein n=1 Tax=Acer saccharum TaxID=4024 RepID=A0AA39VJG7_ACESA|nr:hypothetical protein LWI29_029101 [Acer saccharum]
MCTAVGYTAVAQRKGTVWVVVEGDWGQSVYLDGVKYLVPIRFSPRDKWSTGVLSVESRRILKGIQDRNYTNSKYPTCDPFEGTRLERYLRISLAHPGLTRPDPLPANSPVLSPSSVGAAYKSQPLISAPPSATKGLVSNSLTPPPTKVSVCPSLSEMLARAAKAKVSPLPSSKKVPSATAPPPVMMVVLGLCSIARV